MAKDERSKIVANFVSEQAEILNQQIDVIQTSVGALYSYCNKTKESVLEMQNISGALKQVEEVYGNLDNFSKAGVVISSNAKKDPRRELSIDKSLVFIGISEKDKMHIEKQRKFFNFALSFYNSFYDATPSVNSDNHKEVFVIFDIETSKDYESVLHGSKTISREFKVYIITPRVVNDRLANLISNKDITLLDKPINLNEFE